MAFISAIHTAQIALLYCLKLPVCKPTNGDALRKALNGRAVMAKNTIYKHSVGRGDSSHFPHIYNSLKTGRAGIVCSSVMVVPHMTFMHSEYP